MMMSLIMLQQYLPFTVLKLTIVVIQLPLCVATVLTVYGIETKRINEFHKSISVATVLTVYGIETSSSLATDSESIILVATVLTVYGIETRISDR